MKGRGTGRLLVLAMVIVSFGLATAHAGMPAPLPSNWTKDHQPEWASSRSYGASADSGSTDARLQAISFFVASLLLCAWGVQVLWRVLRRDLTWLPPLPYSRSLSLVVLWGLLFVIVLTMISGARELMTPGAWRKQGWTYKLNDQPAKTLDSRAQRTQALERLRLELWRYAATHQGHFPAVDDPAIDPDLWNVPGWPGLKFIMAPDRTAEESGRLLVCEPELDGDERQVLLTNGLLGTMRTAEIRQSLATNP